jgi:hypothetical protein
MNLEAGIMAKKIIIWLAADFIICGLFCVNLYAKNEQWLQYHSARELNLVGISSIQKILEISDKKPADVNMPKFTGDSQLFTKWMTPMVEKGFLWVALDRSHKLGMYDILYIDSNGDGRLDDEEPIRQYRMEQTSSSFGPVKVVFKLADGPTSYHLNFMYYGYEDTKMLYVSSGGWYQGEINVDGQKKQCVLFDYNTNGTFNDKAIEPENSDRIRISDSTNSQDASFVGNYIQINGKYYEPEIARDGAYVKLGEAKDIKYGKIRLPENVNEVTAGGLNGQFKITPENGIGNLPVGKYQINSWIVRRQDDKGVKWELDGTQQGTGNLFDVKESEEIAIEIGEPIVSTLIASYGNGSYSFNQQLQGKKGETITITRNGAQPEAPKLNIKNKDGTYDKTYTFSYG